MPDFEEYYYSVFSALEDAKFEVSELTKQRDELLLSAKECYQMLLSEPNTKSALFKAEEILRKAITWNK